ncbi:hypothetical protein OKW29_002167 [Paraburkholderia sp. CI3]
MLKARRIDLERRRAPRFEERDDAEIVALTKSQNSSGSHVDEHDGKDENAGHRAGFGG